MADLTVSFEATGNHWFWRAADDRDCQTGTEIVMPEDGTITGVELKVAGLNYTDPVYGYQYHSGYMRPCVWDRSGNVVTTGSYTTLPPSTGGNQPWVYFDLKDTKVTQGKGLIVGFWRDSNSVAYATQWDYCTDSDASGYTTVSQDLFGSGSGPFNMSITKVYSDTSINFRLHYESGGRVKVWNGRVWVSTDVNYWDGNSWDKTTVNVFDGTSWKESGE